MELKALKLQNNSDKCMICGLESLFSLGAKFYELQKDVLCTITSGREEHQSYPNRMHGGMITALLDETIGRAILIKEPTVWGVTTKIEVKFRKPVPLNESIKCFARIVKNTQLGFVGVGGIEDENGNLLASAEATYMKLPIETIAGESADFVWENFPDERGIKFVNIKNTQILGL